MGYLVDKTLNPFAKLCFLIFFSLNKEEFIICSKLYLKSAFASKIFLNNSCKFLLILNGKENSPDIIFFCKSKSLIPLNGNWPTIHKYNKTPLDHISANSG